MYELVIVADSNDADYVTSIEDVSQVILDDIVIPIANAIKNLDPKERHNWPDMWDSHHGMKSLEELYSDIDPDKLQWFREMCPTAEGGIHTIESITYYLKPEKIELL